ncbi:hypothetical protein RJ639_039950 [Escallonia herrerae]|uniref:Uncharacterized protein n=1 Tax=Escallonia herrerae TaxID=1293975 RepID=A0AA89B8W4_9ASTE|nr:hypothetical protein RJ639_039950 [Escallonia herrerae]
MGTLKGKPSNGGNLLPNSGVDIKPVITVVIDDNVTLVLAELMVLRFYVQADSFTSKHAANTSINQKETPEVHVSNMDLPELQKEGMEVEVKDRRVLEISDVQSKEEGEKIGKLLHRVKRSGGKFVHWF